MSAAYMPESSGSMFFNAALTIVRTERRGWFLGTKSSKRRMVNKLSVKVSFPLMVWCLVACKIAMSTMFEEARRWTFGGGISAAC